ncbi:hypothetical protein KY284_035415 [Solanum tuberosum]|nr:hypothetical protein KY284_035415 [Solanum tuberosum]
MTEKIQRCCEVCPNLSFDDGGDGFFYCTGCGSQANDIIDTGVIAIMEMMEDYYSEIRLRYVMGLQAMIQMRAVQDSGEIELSQPTGSQKTEPHNLLGKRAVTIWHKSLSSMVPLPCSLAISFLVCHVARESILPTDILKWTLEGKLPYFAAFLEIEKQLGPPSRSCPISTICMLRPIRTVTLQKLEFLAASIARKIGLELPSVNFHAIAARYLKHLSLPVEKILPQACQVYEWSMPPELYLSDNDSRLPSRCLLLSVENGAGECGFSCNARGAVAEDDSASRDSDPHDSMSKSNSDALKLLKIIEEKFLFLFDRIFKRFTFISSILQRCGLGPAYDDHEEKKLIEVFWDSYQSRKAGKASEDRKTNSHTCNNFHHSGFRHGCSSTPKESENFRDDACKCKCKCKMSRDDGDSNATLRQLKADMKENRCEEERWVHQVAQVDVRTMHVGVLAFEKRLEMLERRIHFCLCKRLPDDFWEFCCDW